MALGAFRPQGFQERGSRTKIATDHLPISHPHERKLAVRPGGSLRGRQRLYLTWPRWPSPEEKGCHLTTLQPSPRRAKPLWFRLIPFSLPLLWLMHKGLGVAKSAVVLVWKRHPECEWKLCFGISLSSQLSQPSQVLLLPFCDLFLAGWTR